MSCIVTLKINDYYPKIDSIPYDNFVCLFTYGDFFVKIPLIQKSNNICKHEIYKISSDIKYSIHILEINDSSLIGISEMVIPFIKIKKINAPGTMIQEQKIKLIIDLNTKRKLFGKIINSDDIYLLISAEVFIPDKNNIIINNEILNANINNNMIKKNTNSKIQVKISNKKNNLDGSPHTIRKKKMIIELKNNREIIKNDNTNDNINYNLKKNNVINSKFNHNEINNIGKFKNTTKFDNNQIKIIDFKNKNDNLNKNNEGNLTAKELKKNLNKKRSPKRKITILELLEQKMQISNNNNGIVNNRSNTNGNNINENIDNTITNNKSYKKIKNKNNNYNENVFNNIKNKLKRINKNENIKSIKYINSITNSQESIIITPIKVIPQNVNNINNKIKNNNNNSKGKNRKSKKNNNDNNSNILNGKGKNSQNKIYIKNKRNSSQETIARDKYKINNKKDKKQNGKDSFILEQYILPKIDVTEELFSRKSYNSNKAVKGLIKENNSSYSNLNNNDITSNNGLLSTDERTEQGLSEIDKIILEKGAKLRDQFQNQLKNNYSNNLELNNKKNDNKIKAHNSNQIYYDIVDNQIIGAGNYTIETPKTSQDIDTINNCIDNRVSFSSSHSLSNNFTQEDLKNNYIKLIDLYQLLNHKLSKILIENHDLYKKLNIYKEKYNNEIKKEKIKESKDNKYKFNFFINANLKQSLNYNVFEKLAFIQNLESKINQDIFDYNYNDYEIIRIKELERVQKLNEERKKNVLLKVINCIIYDCGNVSQIFHDNKGKQKLLQKILIKNNIKEKKEGEENYINLQNFNYNNDIHSNYNNNYIKYNYYNNYNSNNKFKRNNKYNILDDEFFENKVIREVDEDKEEEDSNTTSNKKKGTKINEFQNNESIIKNININEENEINNNNDNNESYYEEGEIKNLEETPTKIEEKLDISIKNDEQNENEEENKKLNIIKDILINNFKEKYGKKSLFIHIDKNEFLFDDKYNTIIELNNNNEIIIEIENKKYNIEEFISIYYKNDDKENENNDNNKNEKHIFLYKKKIRQSHNTINKEQIQENELNQHQKKRRKKRIKDDDDSEKEGKEKDKNNENNNKEIISSDEKIKE